MRFLWVQLFAADKQKNPYTKQFDKAPEDYNGAYCTGAGTLQGRDECYDGDLTVILKISAAGPRSAKAIADAVLAQLPDTFIATIRSAADFEAFEAGSALPKGVLASTRAKATPLYKSLSLRFKGRLAFATVLRSASSAAVQSMWLLTPQTSPQKVALTAPQELCPCNMLCAGERHGGGCCRGSGIQQVARADCVARARGPRHV